MLSEEQLEIFNSYKNGENLFITGPGGCGKSYLIKHIVKDAIEEGTLFSVTALTGCAAILLGSKAKTIHSWAGIGLAKGDDNVIATRIALNNYKKRNWKKTDLLIIDEVSMMSLRLFNLLDTIGKKIRKNAMPFGGIQVIFCGDFYQLSPVGNRGDPDSFKFCFESDLWNETFDSQYILDKTYRQSDEVYIEILNQIREGNLQPYYYNILKKRVAVKPPYSGIRPVILYPTKRNVESLNYEKMCQLNGDSVSYKYMIELQGSLPIKSSPGFKTNMKTDIIDKEGILTILESMEKNGLTQQYNKGVSKDAPKIPDTKTILNVINFLSKNSYFSHISEYKIGSQVMCIANIDIENGIYNGSVGIITGFDKECVKVRFNNNVEQNIGYYSWSSDMLPGVGFKQIPLILAWAVTIHKSQGATLDCAEIDVGSSVFAEGQTYVALSRVKSLDGLYLKSLDKNKIKVNPKVVEFYKKFYEE